MNFKPQKHPQYLKLIHQQFVKREDLQKYGYPVDLEKCQNHRMANLICKNITDSVNFTKEKVTCECCQRIVGSEPTKMLCYDNNIFAKYGPGIPLYFQFFQDVCYLLIMYLVVFGIYGTVSNFMSKDCQRFKHCWSDTFGMQLSFLNSYEEGNVTMIQLILIIMVVILQIFVFMYIRHKLRQKKQIFDNFLTSPNDFSIILRQLPKGTDEKDIQDMVDEFRKNLTRQEKAETNNLKIHKIIFAYNIKEYLKVSRQNIQNFKKSCKEMREFHKIRKPEITQKLSTSIVIFQKELSKNFFLGYFSWIEQLKRSHWLGHQPLSAKVKVKGEYVNCERAPEPDDIIWENEGISMMELLIRRTGVYFFSFGMLIISAGFQYVLARWRMRFSYHNQMIQRLFSLGLACFITVINYLLTLLLIFSCELQKPRTHTLLKISMTFKVVLMQFINSGIISIVITAAIYLPEFRFYKTVICSDMLFIMVMNVIVNNGVNFILVRMEITAWVDRLLFRFRFIEYTQAEANRIFQASEVDIEYKYAYIFKTLWLTAFFMPTQPVVVFFSILALVLNYWTEKYLFSGFYSIPHMLSGRISISVLDLLNYTTFWLVLGSFFIHFLRLNFHITLMPLNYIVLHVIGLLLSLVIIYAPLSTITKNIYQQNIPDFPSYKSYELQKDQFEVTYQGSNPAYKKDRPFRGKFDQITEKLAVAFNQGPIALI